MATLEQLETALRAADAAGNVEDARALAAAYESAKGAAAPADTAGVPRVEIRGTADSAEPDRRGAVANALYRTANAVTPFGGVLNLIGSGDPIRDARNLGAGMIRGAGSIGATIMTPVDWAARQAGINVPGLGYPEGTSNRRELMDMFLGEQGAEKDSGPFQLGKISAEIAGTSGVGPGLAAGVSRLAGAVPQIGRFAGPLANALQSGGTATGLTPKGFVAHAADYGYRGLGGGLAGAGAAAATDPETAGTGALIGTALGPGLKLAGQLGDVAGRGINYMRNGPAPRDAQTILDIGGYTPAEIPNVRSMLSRPAPWQGPDGVDAPRTVAQVLAGGKPTAAQNVQGGWMDLQPNGAIAQFGRTMRNAGDQAGLRVEQLQDLARIEALNKVAPVGSSSVEVAADFGGHFRPAMQAKDAAAAGRVDRLFKSTDPFLETRIGLPVDAMDEARTTFLRPEVFGSGGAAGKAVDKARAMSEVELPAVQALKAPVRQGEDLFTAMRALGGIKQDAPGAKLFAGEIKDLKQSGARGVIQNGRGQSPDILAQSMHARGFIADDDPATLFNAMREHAAGRKVFASSSDRKGAMRAGIEAAQGDAPGAEILKNPVTFDEVQDLRSWISGKAAKAKGKPDKARDYAALKTQLRELDDAVERAAKGEGQPGDYFPKDIADRWREARAAHQARKEMFREPVAVGSVFKDTVDEAALAGKAYSARPSQAQDVRDFRAVADPESLALLKSYATTGAAGNKDVLTNAQFNNFLKARAGANAELFSDAEQARLRAISSSLKEADRATVLGMAKGSPTEQNRIATAMSLGALDGRMATLAAKAIPYIGAPALEGIRNVVTKAKVNRLGRLMADPVELERAIARLQQLRAQGAALNLGGTAGLAPMIGRSAPVLLSGQ